MASDSIEEVFGEVLAEHGQWGSGCRCGAWKRQYAKDPHPYRSQHNAHVAEQPPARVCK